MTLDEMKGKLESTLSAKRFNHSIGVMKCAGDLAREYGEDVGRAAAAGLLHDCARDIRGKEVFLQCELRHVTVDDICREQPELLHGPLGAVIAGEAYGVTDEGILNAVRYHTTGCTNMRLLEKIVFLADYIEPGRDFPGVLDIREAAFEDIDFAMIMALDRTIRYVISKGALIHPLTVSARNELVLKRKRG